MPVAIDPDSAGFITYFTGAAILIVALIIFAHILCSDALANRAEPASKKTGLRQILGNGRSANAAHPICLGLGADPNADGPGKT